MNTYSLEERATKSSSYRRIEVQASDIAVGALTARLPFGLNAPLRPLNIQEVSTENIPLALPDSSEKTIMIESSNQTGFDDRRGEANADLLGTNNLFTEHSDHGIIPSKTLRDYIQKLPSKKEKQQVFAIMFVWAYNQYHSKDVSHEALVAAMKYEHLYDSNSKKHLAEVAKNYFKIVDNHYEISNYDGRQQVNNIIEGIRNPGQIQVSTESKKPIKRGRTAGSTNKAEIEAVKPWLDMSLEVLNSFDARKLHSASDWGTFGLYILTKILQVQEAVKAGIIYTFLAQKYPTIPVSRKTFIDTMRRTKNIFSLSAGGAYFLTEAAEKEMKKLIEDSGNT